MKPPKTLLVVIIGIVLSIAAPCGVFIAFFESWEPVPAEEPALDRTNLLLEAAKSYPEGSVPTDLPLDARYGVGQCWSFLQESMAANNNQYTLTVVGVWGDAGTQIGPGTGTTEVVIEVIFPDKTRIEMYYYAYRLEVCRELNDDR